MGPRQRQYAGQNGADGHTGRRFRRSGLAKNHWRDADRFLGLDPADAEWTNEKPGDKVGQDQRLPGKMGQQARHSGEQDA
jgi:hypothetical protein